MGGINLDKLYDNYNVLSQAKEKAGEYEKEYLEAIECTKGSDSLKDDEKENDQLKKLAAQIISKFFKYFPSLQDHAVEVLFDLCENENTTITIAAMHALANLCKDVKERAPRVAFILAQLLQLTDPQEYNIACNSLMQVLKEDPKGVVQTIFGQIHSDTNSTAREKCIKFIISKVKTLDKALYTSELEDVIIEESKKVLESANSDEFLLLMPFLGTTKMGNTLTGQKELIDIAAKQMDLDQEFDPLDPENNQTDRVLSCIKTVLPFFSSKNDSQKFVTFITDQVLPNWEAIGKQEKGDMLQLAILRQLAELSTHCGKLENPSLHVVQIFQKMKDYMPPPPEDVNLTEMPYLDFSSVECLLYAFHRLARQCPDFLTCDPAILKDFRARLMYFARGVQGCSRALTDNKKRDDKEWSESDLFKMKLTPKIFSNINLLIKDLFYQPPVYKCNVTLSYKIESANVVNKTQEKAAYNNTVAAKRHTPITFESNGSNAAKKPKVLPVKSGYGMKIYTPPSGKFSNSFQNYDRGGNPRGRGSRGMRGGRGGRR